MKLVDSWDIEQNFWQLNPQLKLAFKEVYDGDKSKTKDVSSKLMWSIALFTDLKSKFKDVPEREREELIKKDFYKDFSVEKNKEYITKWRSFLSAAEKQLVIWERVMHEKNDYMSKLKYETDSDELEKKLLSNGKLFEELARLKDLIAEEESDGIVKGGAVESLSETGEI